MALSQVVPQPFRILVFGSAIVRVEPDIASIHFSVSRLTQNPKDSFAEVRVAAQGVQSYLASAHITEAGSSHVSLEQSFQYKDGVQRFVGHTATVSFHILLRDLNRMEEVLAGVVDAGVNRINVVHYETSRLKEIRAESRKKAIGAAREKAEIYCGAAGVQLGAVVYIEDVNPDMLRGREGHSEREDSPDDTTTPQAFNPGSIVVGAAVRVAYEIHS
jgi:uncharacterized protein YggE